MDIASSALSNSLKVRLQIATNYKRPLLEDFFELRNDFGPETTSELPLRNEDQPRIVRHRSQDISVHFTLINIGGVRAENINISISGELKRSRPRDNFGEKFNTNIYQMAPGQSLYLFKFENFDLLKYPENGGKPLGLKEDKLVITISYDPPKSLLNSVLTLASRFLKKKHYTTQFKFTPQMVAGDLPPANYA